MATKYFQGAKSKSVQRKATPELVAAIKPLLVRAVKANLERWDAEREIENALGFDVNGIYDYYDGLCVGLDEPSEARKYVTAKVVREFIEDVIRDADLNDLIEEGRK